MYGLKQVARLAFNNLVKILAPHGYLPVREYTGSWKIRYKPHCLPFVLTILVSNPIQWKTRITS